MDGRRSEIVVVDSCSTDGTRGILKEHVPHSRVTFLQHPPGLYESWEFWHPQVKTDYDLNISTVRRNTVTPPGLASDWLGNRTTAAQADIVP